MINLKKTTFISLAGLILFSGCTDSSKKEEVTVEVKKEIVKKTAPKKQMTVHEKKQRFKDILVPIAVEVYKELDTKYNDIKVNITNNENRDEIERLKKEYKAKTDKALLEALKPHPISIVLAQAAAESAWLTSRFTKEANNIFGVWSFNKKEPRIAASGMRGDKTIYLKKYKTIKDAVKDYYKNLGKNWAYKEFRNQRTLTSNPYVLADYLTSYSEKKEEYTKLLRSMIKYNKFDKYDLKSEMPYTQYIEKQIKVVKVIEDTTIAKDTNQTIVEVIDTKKITVEVIKKDTAKDLMEKKDINETLIKQKIEDVK